MTLSLYEDALAPLQDHLPEWWATDAPATPIPPTLLATNLVTNPSFEQDTIGSAPAAWVSTGPSFWIASGAALTALTGTVVSGSNYMRVVTAGPQFQGCSIPLGTLPAGTYTVAIYLQGAAGGEQINVFAGQNAGTNSNSVAATLTTGSWTRYTVTFTTDGTGPCYVGARASTAVARTFYVDAAIAVSGSTVPTYFDGDTDPGRTTLWTGAPGTSTSQLYDRLTTPALLATNLVTNPSFEVDTSGWLNIDVFVGASHATITRVADAAGVGGFAGEIVTDGTTDGGVGFRLALRAGVTYTVRLRFKRTAGTTPAKLAIGCETTPFAETVIAASATDVAFTNYTVQFTPATTDNYFLYCRQLGGTASTYRIDGAMVAASSPTVPTVPYFDGNTDPTGSTRWTGAPNASTSELYAGDLTPPSAASTLYAFLVALSQPIDGLSADLEKVHADMALVNATLDGLRAEYAYAYGVGFEQLPPTSDALRSYIKTWAGVNGSTASVITALTALLTTPVNTTGTQLVFDAGGAGLTFPADGSGLAMFQQVQEVGFLSFPVDSTGLVFNVSGAGIIFPNVSGWVVITENATTYTWTVTTKSYLNFDRTAFARAVERLRQAHLLPAVITEVST